MDDQRSSGPISMLAVPLAETLREHDAKPPFQKNIARASFGAGLLTLCAYVAVTLGPIADRFPPVYRLVWLGLVGFGVLLLVVGVRGARGPRDAMLAFWAVAVPAAIGWALWHFAGPELFDNFYVRGFTYATVVSATMRVWLALRGISGSAEKTVRRQVEQNEVVWRSARRR